MNPSYQFRGALAEGIIYETYASVVTGDRDIQSLEVKCGNLGSSCSWRGELRDLGKHISQCLQSCKYAPVGCMVKMLSENLAAHEEVCIVYRLKLAMAKIEALEKKLEKTSLAATPISCAPVTFRFKGQLQGASAPFYSHPNGYKFMLTINYAVLTGLISVKVFLMRGEYDDDLTWPFRGVVSFVMLNQQENSGHINGSAKFKERKTTARNQRVAPGHERNDEGWGENLLLDNIYFLSEGCVFISVTEVLVESVGKSWLNEGLVAVNTT